MKKFFRAVALSLAVVFLLGVSPALAADQVFPTLTVAGSATVKTVPDIGTVTFSVKTFDVDAGACQEENREKSNRIYDALAALEIEGQMIKTQSYTIRPVYENVRVEQKVEVLNAGKIEYKTEYRNESVFQGYETVHAITVTLNGVDEDMSLLGKVIDLSVTNGANQTNGVAFTLSDEKREAVYMQALAEAAGRANAKAQTVAAQLGMVSLKPVTVNVENINVYSSRPAVVPSASVMEEDVPLSGGSGQEPAPRQIYTPISPGETSISANVSVIFTY